MNISQISDSELTLMRIIWEKGGTALYAAIMETLEGKGYDWQRTTVLTFLSRLVDKKMLAIGKIGRRNEYKALISEEEYSAAQTQIFVDKVYEGNVAGLVNTLLRQEMVTDEDKEALRRFWLEGTSNDE